MELGGREILIALGALLIVAILLDGFRRVRRAGKGRLRVKRRRQPIFDNDDFDEFGSELPNGKARVVSFRDEDSAEQFSQTIKANRQLNDSRLTAPFRRPEQEQEPVVDTGAVSGQGPDPLGEEPSYADAMASVDASTVEVSAVDASTVDVSTVDASALEPTAGEGAFDQIEITQGSEDRARIERETQFSLFGAATADEDDGLIARPITTGGERASHESAPVKLVKKGRKRKKSSKERLAKERPAQDKPAKSRANKSKTAGAQAPVQPRQSDIDDDVVILHLMAEQGQVFQGDDLLKAVVDNGLRYGSLKIFHRHVREDGSGDVLFSMANSVNPGTFELNAMGEFSTPGVTFMMVMDDSEDPLGTFDLMLACIHGVNSAIGGDLKDQQRSALSRQTAEHYRQRIMDFKRRRLAAGA